MTTGEQVKKFLYTLYPDYTPKYWDDNWMWHFRFDKPTQLSIRVNGIGTVDKLIEALKISGIDPMFVDINTMWDKLHITICDYEKDSELDFSTDY